MQRGLSGTSHRPDIEREVEIRGGENHIEGQQISIWKINILSDPCFYQGPTVHSSKSIITKLLLIYSGEIQMTRKQT